MSVVAIHYRFEDTLPLAIAFGPARVAFGPKSEVIG